MEQKLATLLRVVSASELQIDIARASLAKSANDAFKLIDTCGRNMLSSFEIAQFLEKNKVKLEQDEIRMIVQYYDLLRKGKLDLETFKKALTPRNNSTQQSDSKDVKDNLIEFFNKELDLIRKTQNLRIQLIQAAQEAKVDVYKVLDKDAKGELTYEDIDAFLQKQGIRMAKAEIQAILQRGDRSGNNILNQQDFEYFIVPDVTSKKVIAKEPDLSPIVEAREPVVPKQEYSHHNNYPSQGYSQAPRANAGSPLNNMLTVSQIVEKYDNSRNRDYHGPSTTKYTPYTQGYEPTQTSYVPPPSLSNQNLRNSQIVYSSHYTPKSHIPDIPYYPGMYSNMPLAQSQSRSNLQIDTTSHYHLASPTHYKAFDIHDYQGLRASRYIPEREPVTTKARSNSGFDFTASRSANYERKYENNYDDFSPSNHHYDRQARDLVSTGAYQSPMPTYERPLDRSYTRSITPVPVPRSDTGYSYQRQTPKNYSYKAEHVPNYRVDYREDNQRTEQRSASSYHPKRVPVYEDCVYKIYEPIDHLRLASDIFNRDELQQTQGLRDWGVSSIYTPKVKAQGSGLYDHSQLQRKYDDLARTRIFL